MKKRIKIDSSILSFVIILTGFLYQFPQMYSTNRFFDNILDFVGLIVVLKGTFIRMAARGHKKAHSKKGEGLVIKGLYQYTRNPMYLGSFLMGAGFVLIVWPWWSVVFFGGLFCLRFNRQVVLEETHLTKLFGKEYQSYCRRVPRVFPKLKNFKKVKMNEVFCWEEIWTTKEKRGLVGWPILAILLETFQEKIIFNVFDIRQTIAIFLYAMVIFFITVGYQYGKNK